MSTLKDPCKYSFKDLFIASNHPVERLSEFYKLSLKDRNIIVKEMCKTAGWVCEDVISEDQIFTAFSPSTNEINCK